LASEVGRVAEQLLRAHRRRPFDHLVIVACDQLRRVIDASLDQELKDVLREIIDADLAYASIADIRHVVTPIVEGAERTQERAALTCSGMRSEPSALWFRDSTGCLRCCSCAASSCC
jgi:hypothetical protein